MSPHDPLVLPGANFWAFGSLFLPSSFFLLFKDHHIKMFSRMIDYDSWLNFQYVAAPLRWLFCLPTRSCCTAQITEKMVNAIKGLFISCDVPMAQFIVNLNASMPSSDKFIVHMLDATHMFVQPHMAEMIRSKIAEFRDQNSYEKPS
ncbi:hypothetical protein ABZP36_028168 [Zizania latifolia]